MAGSKRKTWREALAQEQPLLLPCAHDALSARLIERAGFTAYSIGGFALVGSRYAVPDIGLAAYAEISAGIRDIMAATRLPVLVDGDTGYGDVKNVAHTIEGYEAMGAAAIFLEDQVAPKRCGHMAGKDVIAAEQMVAKIKAAVGARRSKDFFIIARTDARAVHGLDEALRRGEQYLNAGADGIFIEAPRSLDELKRIGKMFDVPQICNPLMGGHTPILSMEELGELGFNCAVLGLDTVMHAARAIENVLLDMKSGKFALRNDGMDFEDYKKVVGYDKWESVDERFAPKQ